MIEIRHKKTGDLLLQLEAEDAANVAVAGVFDNGALADTDTKRALIHSATKSFCTLFSN